MDRDKQGLTPSHWAAGTGTSTQGVRTGTLSTAPEEEDSERAINDRVETCKYLIEQGTDVNTFGGNVPATPLQWAARKGLVKIIDLLIQRGANPRLVDPQDFSCLHSVTHSSNFWAVLYIICQPDIDIDVEDHTGLTPLHWAARQGDEVSTQILLKYGANPEAVDRDDLTALHWAASGGNKTCITLLLEAGADIQAKNKDQHTAQDMADSAVWDMVVGELGIKSDGMRIRRPLSEVCVPTPLAYMTCFSRALAASLEDADI
jgi:palmitoyltransferase